MARWEPGAAERLREAAMELFVERGYDQVTAAEIAAAAGLTERTFFRHFADKRDVLFFGQDAYVQSFLDGIEAAGPDASTFELCEAALASATELFPNSRRPRSRARQRLIDAHPQLQERERHKSADLAVRLAAALRERGVPDPTAAVAAESTVMVFGTSFTLWVDDEGPDPRSMTDVVTQVLGALRAFATT